MNLAYKYHRLKLGLGLFFIFQIPTYSQSFPVKTYTLANGLNTNFIHDVTQDKQGNMWFATEFGVSVYDGYSFKNYREEDGLPQTEYFQIKADSNNNIIAVPSWSTQHIAIFTNKKWQLINSLPSLKGNNNYYTSFDINYEKNKLILYLGTLEGVYKYSDNKWSNISVREGLINNQINTIKNNNNKLYVCTESGLSIIENGKIDNSLNSVLKSSSKKIRS
ncbi:MAG: two-component regulator propeller domain-containing protein, partial [Melioribacteraceae bacterium]